MTEFITATDLDTFISTDEKTRLTTAGLTPERYLQTVADTNSEVAGYVGARVLASVPPALKHHACALARYRLHKDKVSERMTADLDLANKFFKSVADGSWALPLVPDPASPEPAGLGVWFSAQPSRFTGQAY
jgi:phage gp36-like protein